MRALQCITARSWPIRRTPEKFYAADTSFRVSDDGGRTIRALGDRNKHVDSHTIWVDPRNTDHIFVGCDGGVYESFDGGQFWQFKANLPTLQFYDVDVDYAKPFYHVYGGTQDNFSWGGPAATRNVNGIMNSDWYVTTGGDGFVSRVDPADPDTVYAESQGGGLVRYNRKTGAASTSNRAKPRASRRCAGTGMLLSSSVLMIISGFTLARTYCSAATIEAIRGRSSVPI